MHPWAAWIASLLLLLGLQACGRDVQTSSGSEGASAEITARASLLFEPPTIGLGSVTTAVILVTTPPGHRVLPPSLPEIPGVWVLEILVDPTEKSERRWLHRTRVRLRPRETGSHVFPGTKLVIESARGEQRVLELRERKFEVVSVLPQFPARTAPFGLQESSIGASTHGFLLPAAVGAFLALAAVATIVGARRLRRSRGDSAPPEPAEDAPTQSLWEWSQAEIARAFESLERDPRTGANLGARFLRHYVESRFHTPAAASTTQELTRQKPPLAAHRHWPDFVRVLRRLDELRFRPGSTDASAPRDDAGRIRAALEETRSFLERSSPPDRRS